MYHSRDNAMIDMWVGAVMRLTDYEVGDVCVEAAIGVPCQHRVDRGLRQVDVLWHLNVRDGMEEERRVVIEIDDGHEDGGRVVEGGERPVPHIRCSTHNSV